MQTAVLIEPAGDGGFIARVPALPGCVTEGDTWDEALAMAQDAIRGYLDSLKRHGDPGPPQLPNPIAFMLPQRNLSLWPRPVPTVWHTPPTQAAPALMLADDIAHPLAASLA